MATKTHKIAAKIPQSREAAEAEMRELGNIRIQVADIDNILKTDSQKLIQTAKDLAAPLLDKAAELEEGLMAYAAAHRDELTDGNKSKRGKMLSGHFDWRKLPDKVALSGVDAIIERIKVAVVAAKVSGMIDMENDDEEEAQKSADKALKLDGFLRVKTSINKDAMLASPDLAKTIDGVVIKSPGERLEIEIYENSLND